MTDDLFLKGMFLFSLALAVGGLYVGLLAGPFRDRVVQADPPDGIAGKLLFAAFRPFVPSGDEAVALDIDSYAMHGIVGLVMCLTGSGGVAALATFTPPGWF